MIAIAVSRADSASEHIGEHLLDIADWTEHTDDSRPDADGGGTVYRVDAGLGVDGSDERPAVELRTFERIHVELDGVDGAFSDPDLLCFASRHSGNTGPLLTAHFTGNFGAAQFGGADRSLAPACPSVQKSLVAAFEEYAPEGYDVGIECTHHGPSELDVPSVFAELGSGEAEWEDPDGARAVARSILTVAGVGGRTPPAEFEGPRTDADHRLVAFGGGHYAPRPTRLVRETAWSVGHIAADWQLDELGDPAENRDVVAQMFDRSGAEYAVVDGDKPDVEAVVRDLGHRVVSETWVREVDDRPVDAVEELESALSTVDDGLRFGGRFDDQFGDRFGVDGDPVTVVDLPSELLQEAQGIDPESARRTVETYTVAFETTQNGSRAAGRAAVRTDAEYDALVDALADVLDEKYDSVVREADAVVATETAFDPEKATTLGVSEGPAFGRLAAGDPVEVDGKRIDPEVVRTERTRRFPL